MTRSIRAQKWGIYGCLWVMVVISLYPVVVMLMGSVKTYGELTSNPLGWPLHPTLKNFTALFHYNGGLIVRTYINGIVIAVVSTTLTVFVSAMAGYAFAKYKFKGSKILFTALLVTMMVPQQLELPSLYLLFAKLHWLNTFQVQIVPIIASVFTMFMIRQFMFNIPDSLIEASRLDGAGHWYTFTRIILPISRPVLGAMFILTFLSVWNSYLWPLTMVDSPTKMPIMVILPTLNSSANQFFIEWPTVMAGCVIVTVPLMLVFLIFQKQFMNSVTIGAVKE
ncbi:carbohydrate ABC transporter permease [Alicyclobacillus fodiniaquatilis]|jgi:ABC-type glycerol-3-phosphate transport system permease component|uniref:Carbohydrate ABC transporter permease n=1 Tax=Alicyclobacillus fodiniaquatilis TaxID=1661150 RepID=A0ABW4JIA7_9BACL